MLKLKSVSRAQSTASSNWVSRFSVYESLNSLVLDFCHLNNNTCHATFLSLAFPLNSAIQKQRGMSDWMSKPVSFKGCFICVPHTVPGVIIFSSIWDWLYFHPVTGTLAWEVNVWKGGTEKGQHSFPTFQVEFSTDLLRNGDLAPSLNNHHNCQPVEDLRRIFTGAITVCWWNNQLSIHMFMHMCAHSLFLSHFLLSD